MIIVVILSTKCGINPDNVATPIAAALGDLITLLLLSAIVRVSLFLIKKLSLILSYDYLGDVCIV